MKYGFDARIGIVGAGPAGLTAAETLRDKGYKNITILERSERAGGKCHSIQYEGRSYELGAGIVADSSKFIRALAEKYHVPMERVEFGSRMYLDIHTGKAIQRSFGETLSLAWQVCRYWRLAMKYRAIAEPGFNNVPKELCEPFNTWAEKNGIPLLAKEFSNYFTGFGYGFQDEVPAAYVLKYYPWDIVAAYLKRSFYKFPEGIQGLWTAVAKSHHVLYNTTLEQKHDFDCVIVTSPIDEWPEHKELFSKFMYEDYRTYGCIVRNFPRVTGYLPGNQVSSRKGHPVFWYQRYSDSDLYMFYVFGDKQITDEVVLKNIESLVKQLGGTLEKTEVIEHWKFFPHVLSQDMADGFFDKIEALQGQNNTYFAGEALNFSTVTHAAAYAKHVVEKYF